jgi:acyl-CoA hydrolase
MTSEQHDALRDRAWEFARGMQAQGDDLRVTVHPSTAKLGRVYVQVWPPPVDVDRDVRTWVVTESGVQELDRAGGKISG